MIHVQNLTFWYSKKNFIFENLNLQLDPGHIYGLLGKNGVGKTTLLKLISGLSFPKSGSVHTGGAIPKEREPKFLSDIFFVPEEISLPSVNPMKFAKVYGSFYPGFDLPQYRELLKKFEVNEDLNLSIMSHGQRKKAMLSFALACNTKYLFLDEPTNGLDIPSKSIFRSLIASVFSEEKTIILSTHQVRDLQSLIDSVIVLENRKIVLNQSLEQVARKFSFGHSLLSPVPGEIVYSVNSELGETIMTLNLSNEPGQVDLETLFNACIEIPEKLSSVLTANI
jgi:ABC-2 type transport system ATP-binding protein